MKVFLLMILLALSSFAVTGAQARTQFDTGFESGGLSGLRCSGNCPRVTSKRTAKGRYASEFSLTKSMKTSYRTEAVLGKKGVFEFNKVYQMSLDYWYQDWKKDSSADIAPFQIHTKPSAWTKKCSTRSAVSTAPFLMNVKNNKERFITYGGKVLWQGSLQTKKWQNITVRFRISSGRDGFIEAWKGSKKLGRVTGPNSPKSDGCKGKLGKPFFKMGIYKWDWKKGRKRSKTTRRQLFIDNLKITKG